MRDRRQPRTRPVSTLSVVAAILASLGDAVLLVSCARSRAPSAPAPSEVVLYTSVDEDVARPVIARFESESGGRYRVLPVFDIEATKTTGLASRILAERSNPRADVFWSSEHLRTIALAREGALERFAPTTAADIPDEWRDPDGFFVAFAARARVIAWSTARLGPEEAPRRLEDLALPRFHDEVAIANPLFGTTGTEAATLFAELGEARARTLYAGIFANGARIVDGNSVARDLVASGAVLCGLMDTDDAVGAEENGKPLAFTFGGSEAAGAGGSRGTVVIPNTVALVARGPHPEAGRALAGFLASAEAERLLAAPPGRQIPLRPTLVSSLPGAPHVSDIRRRPFRPREAFAALAPSQDMLATIRSTISTH